eukprot:TRINITY_DN112580_c0_g1_i1.p1 TRINITY_DN112580_c0_g1~~TRINITY_DN112580_c0_g1_i1.p1  ORF type:complete len:763 (-),score=90.49 TRINITY_DN112580_c0_g1_i1:110-2398(-)
MRLPAAAVACLSTAATVRALIAPACSTTDGTAASASYPCTCGSATCATGEWCDAGTSSCWPLCSVADGASASSSYPCVCGSAVCANQEWCSSSANFCQRVLVMEGAIAIAAAGLQEQPLLDAVRESLMDELAGRLAGAEVFSLSTSIATASRRLLPVQGLDAAWCTAQTLTVSYSISMELEPATMPGSLAIQVANLTQGFCEDPSDGGAQQRLGAVLTLPETAGAACVAPEPWTTYTAMPPGGDDGWSRMGHSYRSGMSHACKPAHFWNAEMNSCEFARCPSGATIVNESHCFGEACAFPSSEQPGHWPASCPCVYTNPVPSPRFDYAADGEFTSGAPAPSALVSKTLKVLGCAAPERADLAGGPSLSLFSSGLPPDSSPMTALRSMSRKRELDTGLLSVAGTQDQSGSSQDAVFAQSALLQMPKGVVADSQNGIVYFTDSGNHVVRKITLATGQLDLVAGMPGMMGMGGDAGLSRLAQLRYPSGIVLDEVEHRLYVSDSGSHAIRQVRLSGALNIYTMAGVLGQAGESGDGGPALAAKLRFPNGLALDRTAGGLFIADYGNHAVRYVSFADGFIDCVAGVVGQRGSTGDGGPASLAQLNNPVGLAFEEGTRRLYIADSGNHVVRYVDLRSGRISTLAGQVTVAGTSGAALGDGFAATEGLLKQPTGLALDSVARQLFVADSANPAIRMIQLESGIIGSVAYRPGRYGRAGHFMLGGEVGLALEEAADTYIHEASDLGSKRLYMAEAGNHVVRVASFGPCVF